MKVATRWDLEFARTLVERAAADGSGILKATKGKLVHLFCVEDGAVVHAASNVREEQLGAILVRRGALDPVVRVEAESMAREKGVKVARFLLDEALVPDAELTAGIEALVEELVATTLEWGEGDAVWSAGLPRLDGEVKVRMMPGRILARQAGRSVTKAEMLRLRIGSPEVKLHAKSIETFERDTLGAHLLRVCDGTLPLADVVRSSPAEELPTLRAVYGLLLAGRLEAGGKPKPGRSPDARGTEAELTREECFERLGSEGSDHYRLLDVAYEADLPQIRNAYYALARRYHPDRFRSGPLVDLLPMFEKFFTLVTDAYNTLSSPDRRKEYDASLHGRPLDPNAAQKVDTAAMARENFARARILLAKKRHVEAAPFLENAVNLDGSRGEYHLELGMVLSMNGRRRDEAETHLLQAIALMPAATEAHLALGQLYATQGRTEEARAKLRDTLRWDPDDAEAQALLAKLDEKKEAPKDTGRRRGFFRG